MAIVAKPIKCPCCEKELTRIGYTEHGTKVLREYAHPQSWRNFWEEDETGSDCAFYCLICNFEFSPEELMEAGVL